MQFFIFYNFFIFYIFLHFYIVIIDSIANIASDLMDTSHHTSLFNYLSSLHSEFKDPTSSARLKWLYGTTEDHEQGEKDEYTQQLTVNFWRTVILDCNLIGHLGSQHYCLAVDIEKVGDAFYRPDLGKTTALDYILVMVQ